MIISTSKFTFKNNITYTASTKPISNPIHTAIQVHLDEIKDVWRLSQMYSKEGYDYVINLKTNYYIVTGHDIVMYLAALHIPNIKNFDYARASDELFRQSFVKFRRFKYPDSFTTTYAIYAPKKRVNRWFKQNVNRFLTKGLYKE